VTAVAADLTGLGRDLVAETTEIERMVDGLSEPGWATPTPAPGWSVKDQVGHLAYFDDRIHQAMTDPDGFREHLAVALATPDMTDRIAEEHRSLSGEETVGWLRRSRATLVATAAGLDPGLRVPWYGPDMSVASAITARIMETWAHGQDVSDGLGVPRPPTERLRHVAFLGVRTLPNSFATHGLEVPDAPVRVELAAPSGETWTFGPDHAVDRVTGDALDFCLAVTRRRHLADLGLKIRGPVATQWMTIAQAFAGPPGNGRDPGQFAAVRP
jgi:uncharacterized protein (TIGR03084 family)